MIKDQSTEFTGGKIQFEMRRIFIPIIVNPQLPCEGLCSLLVKEFNANANAKSLQSCLTLCDPTDGRPPGSAVPGILQARVLERVAISFSNA